MSVRSVLSRGRAAALQLMVDTCTVERKTGSSFDETTGAVTGTWTTVYTGACHWKGGGSGSDTQHGEGEATLHRYEVRFPWDTSTEIRRSDRLTVTVCDDPWVLGRHFEVVDVTFAGTTTARKIMVEGLT